MIINQANLQTFFTGLKTIFQAAFTSADQQWQKIATRVPSSTSSEDYGWLGALPKMREWIGERVVENLRAHHYSLRNKKFEATVGVPRDDLDDDHIGIYNPITQSMGESAAEHPDELIFGLLAAGDSTKCYDGKNFFSASHPVGKKTFSNLDSSGSGDYWFLLDARKSIKPLLLQVRRDYAFRSITNLEDERVFMTDEFKFGVDARVNAGFTLPQLAYASNQTLNKTNYEAAEKAMRGFTKENGAPFNAKPSIIVVGASNLAAARDLFEKQILDGDTNTLFHVVAVLESPWLD